MDGVNRMTGLEFFEKIESLCVANATQGDFIFLFLFFLCNKKIYPIFAPQLIMNR
jgi:hypothetical protein